MSTNKRASAKTNPDTDLLTEIKERFDYGRISWQDIREQGRLDMRYIVGDIWDPSEKAQRLQNGRLCLNFDELSQHVNQLINDVRESKRAIEVTAMGNGADDDTAKYRQNLIRQIEYRSNAVQDAYVTMFEN